MSKYKYKNNKCLIWLDHLGWKPRYLFGMIGLALLYFFMVCLSSTATEKGITLLVSICAIAALILKRKVVAERFSIPVLAIGLWVLLNGISTFYATSGKFALRAFVVLLSSFCLFLLVLAFSKKSGIEKGRGFATLLESVAALSGLVSIDLLSTHFISTPILTFLGLFSPDYTALIPVEVGVRMNSIFANPNVFAGCMGIGIFVSLGLAHTSQQPAHRRFHLVCLFLSAISFLLAFSMGGCATIMLGFLVYLLLERKKTRGRLFILMLETLVLVGAGGFWVSATALTEWTGVQPIPLVCVIAGAVLLCLLDQFVGQRVGKILEQHTRVVPILIASVVVLLGAFVILAMQLTGAVTLGAGETLRRAAYPEPGIYTLSVVTDGAVDVTLESQNRQDTMMHTSTVIYSGPVEGASVTVPEDSIVVYANFSTKDGATIEKASLQGEHSTAFPLNYTLLPDFIANRMQGLWANQNAIQRLVFFEDGLKLFQRSPVFGLGMGAFENGIVSVQSFFYETKYAHNHYIETLVETGVIGLILFAGVLITSAISVLKSRRMSEEQSNPLTAALGGTLIFMAAHASVEVVFSFYAYLPFAFGIFALISLCCGSTMPVDFAKESVKKGVVWGLAGLIGLYGVLIGCNLYAKALVVREQSFDSLEAAIQLDRFEWADYMLSYVNSSLNMDESEVEIHDKAAKYAQQLERVDSNTIPYYLAKYYFAIDNVEQGFAMSEKYLNYVMASEDAWQQVFNLVAQYYQEDEIHRSGVTGLYQMLEDWNEKNMGTILLSQSTTTWLNELGIA